jgi:hypothetical protein
MEAVLLTADNLVEVAAWCGGQVVEDYDCLPQVEMYDERDPEYADYAGIGEYVIRGTTGRYWSMTEETFTRSYEVLS